MATEYRKFYLVPGQQAPVPGATGVGTPDGGIVWVGEAGTFPSEINSVLMTETEIAQFEARDRIRLTRLQFLQRFTFEELVAIETAAETVPAVRVLQRQQDAAEYVSVEDPATIAGIQLLVSLSLLTSERAATILTL
jgi:hypothetical protein